MAYDRPLLRTPPSLIYAMAFYKILYIFYILGFLVINSVLLPTASYRSNSCKSLIYKGKAYTRKLLINIEKPYYHTLTSLELLFGGNSPGRWKQQAVMPKTRGRGF